MAAVTAAGEAVGEGVSVSVGTGVGDGASTGMALAGGGGATLAAKTSTVGVGGGMYGRRIGVLVGGGLGVSVGVLVGGGGFGVSVGDGGGADADALAEPLGPGDTVWPGVGELPPAVGVDFAVAVAVSVPPLGACTGLAAVGVCVGEAVGPAGAVDVCACTESAGLPSIESSAAAPRRISVRRSSNTRS